MGNEALSEGAPPPSIVHLDKNKKETQEKIDFIQKHRLVPPDKKGSPINSCQVCLI